MASVSAARKGRPVRLMIVLGSGGHTKEMIRLLDLLGNEHSYAYIHCADDALSLLKIRFPGPVFSVIRPRMKVMSWPVIVARTLVAALQSLCALVRFRPRAIISTGPGVAVPACILAKAIGIRVIYIETGSRVFALSSSGRILYRFADLFFVQWPELLADYPRAIYEGRLF
jgi:beta-1,4-N-acetylglucosaminyltransferase